jgi:hypothetical protein
VRPYRYATSIASATSATSATSASEAPAARAASASAATRLGRPIGSNPTQMGLAQQMKNLHYLVVSPQRKQARRSVAPCRVRSLWQSWAPTSLASLEPLGPEQSRLTRRMVLAPSATRHRPHATLRSIIYLMSTRSGGGSKEAGRDMRRRAAQSLGLQIAPALRNRFGR